jgi:dihydroneopterin aldolase
MPLLNSWAFAQAVEESHTVIRVRNLQCNACIGTNAWGEMDKLQPIQVSATLALKRPFESAAAEDAVNQSTVHYGTLSKALLKAAGRRVEPALYMGTGGRLAGTIQEFTSYLCSVIVGFDWKGLQSNPWKAEPVVHPSLLSTMELTVKLPKASLLGTSVSYTVAMGGFDSADDDGAGVLYSTKLAIHDLDIAALIGVNSNERRAKQRVVSNVEIDQYSSISPTTTDDYCELEQLVVRVSHILRSHH